VAIRGCIGLEGLYDLKLFAKDFPDYRGELEYSMTRDENQWESPTDYPFGAQHSPWLILHSPLDPYVNNAQPLAFYSHLVSQVDKRKQRQAAQLHMGLTGGHFQLLEWIGSSQDQVTHLIFAFISSVSSRRLEQKVSTS